MPLRRGRTTHEASGGGRAVCFKGHGGGGRCSRRASKGQEEEEEEAYLGRIRKKEAAAALAERERRAAPAKQEGVVFNPLIIEKCNFRFGDSHSRLRSNLSLQKAKSRLIKLRISIAINSGTGKVPRLR